MRAARRNPRGRGAGDHAAVAVEGNPPELLADGIGAEAGQDLRLPGVDEGETYDREACHPSVDPVDLAATLRPVAGNARNLLPIGAVADLMSVNGLETAVDRIPEPGPVIPLIDHRVPVPGAAALPLVAGGDPPAQEVRTSWNY